MNIELSGVKQSTILSSNSQHMRVTDRTLSSKTKGLTEKQTAISVSYARSGTSRESTLALISLICVKPLVAALSEHRISFPILNSRHGMVAEGITATENESKAGTRFRQRQDTKQRCSSRRAESPISLSFSARVCRGSLSSIVRGFVFAIQNKY